MSHSLGREKSPERESGNTRDFQRFPVFEGADQNRTGVPVLSAERDVRFGSHRAQMYESRRAIPGLNPEIGAWISGFVAGEGCFHIGRTNNKGGGFKCGFTIKLRSDDRPLLEHVQVIFGGRGAIHDLRRESATRHPQSVYQIGAKKDCLFLVDVFDEYPLWPAKKARDFAIWRQAVIFLQGVGGGKTDWTEMEGYFHAIRDGRTFREAPSKPANPRLVKHSLRLAGPAPRETLH